MPYARIDGGTTLDGILDAVTDLINGTDHSPYRRIQTGDIFNAMLDAFTDLVKGTNNSPYSYSPKGTLFDAVMTALTDLVAQTNHSPYPAITDGTAAQGLLSALSDLVNAADNHPYVKISVGDTLDGILDALTDLVAAGGINRGPRIVLSASQDTDGDAQGTAIGTISGGTGPYTVTDATGTTQVSGGIALQVGVTAPSVGTHTITIHDTGVPAAPDATFIISTIPQAPSIALVSTDDSGASNSDNITNVTTPHLDITCPTTPVAGDVINIKDGSTVVASHTLTSGDISGSIAELGLSALGDGVHSLTAQHVRGSLASAYGTALSLTIDATGPTLSSLAGVQDGTTSSQADLSFTTNETGTAWWIISTSATPPSVAQIQAGQDSTGSAAFKSGSQAVSTTGAQSATAGTMTNGTYFLYVQQKDVAGNNSTVAASSSWVQVVTTGPVLTYQGSQSPSALGTYSSPLFTSVPIGTNTLGANRRGLFKISSGSSFLKTSSLLTDVLINGVSVFASAIIVNGSGGSVGSFSGLIIWAWADIPDASTSATVDVKATGTNMNGTAAWECAAYTFDKSLPSQATPTHAESNVTNAAALTTLQNTITTHPNGLLIGAINFDTQKSPAATAWSVTSSTDTLNTDYPGTSTFRFTTSSKVSGTTTQASDQITWSYTNPSQAFSSMLHWW